MERSCSVKNVFAHWSGLPSKYGFHLIPTILPGSGDHHPHVNSFCWLSGPWASSFKLQAFRPEGYTMGWLAVIFLAYFLTSTSGSYLLSMTTNELEILKSSIQSPKLSIKSLDLFFFLFAWTSIIAYSCSWYFILRSWSRVQSRFSFSIMLPPASKLDGMSVPLESYLLSYLELTFTQRVIDHEVHEMISPEKWQVSWQAQHGLFTEKIEYQWVLQDRELSRAP